VMNVCMISIIIALLGPTKVLVFKEREFQACAHGFGCLISNSWSKAFFYFIY
jgi:hypothetical protein